MSLARLSSELGHYVFDVPRQKTVLNRGCKKCGAPVGSNCVTASGNTAKQPHKAR